MSFVNKTNHQYIQGRVASREGVRCQAGGAHDYDKDILKSSYGFTKAGADLASELKGSYAPITSGVTRHNQCGGKKKKRKSRKNKKKKKSRKKKRKRTRKGGTWGLKRMPSMAEARKKATEAAAAAKAAAASGAAAAKKNTQTFIDGTRADRRKGQLFAAAAVSRGVTNAADAMRKSAAYKKGQALIDEVTTSPCYQECIGAATNTIRSATESAKNRAIETAAKHRVNRAQKEALARGEIFGGGRKRKSRKNKRKSRKNKRKSRRKKTKKRRRKTYRGGNCNYKSRKFDVEALSKYNKHGGAYSQYGSNEPNSPTYSFEPTTTKPWALGPGNFKRTVNKF